MIRFIYKVSVFFYGLGLFFLTLIGINAAPIRQRVKKRYLSIAISLFSKLALWHFGVSVSASSKKPNSKNMMYLANHGSYIDILILASKVPCLFITSLDVRNEFFIGILTRLSGCLFVNRKNKNEVKKDLSHIIRTLQDGFNVVLFAEATTTNGEVILPFKSSLIKAAVVAKRSVLPVCIKYHTIENQEISTDTRDFIYYYADMIFFPHIIRLLCCRSIHASIQFLQKIEVSSLTTRKEIASLAYKEISETYFINE